MIRWIIGAVALGMVSLNAYAVSGTMLWSSEFWVSTTNGALWVAVLWTAIDGIQRRRARYHLPRRNMKLRK